MLRDMRMKRSAAFFRHIRRAVKPRDIRRFIFARAAEAIFATHHAAILEPRLFVHSRCFASSAAICLRVT